MPSTQHSRRPFAYRGRDANWWSNLSTPLRILDPYDPADSASKATVEGGKPLNTQERTRLSLYHAAVALTRVVGGSLTVATSEQDVPVAICLWFPPHARPSYWSQYRSGVIRAVLGFGITGIYRLLSFQDLTKALYTSSLPQLGIQHEDCGYVWILCTDPEHAGHGHAEKLLIWEVKRHHERFPTVPALLDTATAYAVKVYERIGFRVIATKQMRLEVDGKGFRDVRALTQKEKDERAGGHTVCAMICEGIGET
ncbi:hypothetical protein LTR56_027975 [Elasticomyces elasticus]|nr:hypothetical protein LTR56_027975 [Elasticomyces elasticus]KAK3613615.1 hypothetical protein LTR22_028082 [Elasticomyces elasticus]